MGNGEGGMRNEECGMGNGEWGGESNFLAPTPHSPLPTPFLSAFDLACAALPNTLAFAVTNAFYLRKV